MSELGSDHEPVDDQLQTSTNLRSAVDAGYQSDDDSDSPKGEDWVNKSKGYRRRYLSQRKSKYISQAPLHVAWPYCRNIPREELRKLEAKFTIKRGPFSEKEDKRICKNWTRLTYHFPELDDQIAAFFRIKRDEETDELKPCRKRIQHARFKQNFNLCKGYMRMAYKLKNRLVCDVYFRCRKLIACKGFKYSAVKDLKGKDRKREKVVKEVVVKNKEFLDTSCKHDISPPAVYQLKRSHNEKSKRCKWKPLDDQALVNAIRECHPDENPLMLTRTNINWQTVNEVMVSCDYELKEMQLIRRWRTISASIGLEVDMTWDELQSTIQDRLRAQQSRVSPSN